MLIGDIMNVNATRIRVTATMRQAAELVSQSQSSDLMVVDGDNNFVGVLSEGDLIRAVLPKYDELVKGGVTNPVDLFVERGHEKAEATIAPLVIRSPIMLSPADPVLKAASTMVSKQIRRLPVVDKGKLVGTVSRADICRAILG